MKKKKKKKKKKKRIKLPNYSQCIFFLNDKKNILFSKNGKARAAWCYANQMVIFFCTCLHACDTLTVD
jgi:hypothetical protein